MGKEKVRNENRTLPPHAKRVFKGEIFEVWQWEQTLYDGSTAIFERVKRPDTAQVIPVVGDQILIQKQFQPHEPEPYTALSGGRCDAGEAPLEAAKRELLEETGYASDDWELWKVQNPVSKMAWTIYTYVARDCAKRREPRLDAGEKIETRLISFDEFLALSEDPRFYEKELGGILLRMRFDEALKREFRKLLFGR